MGLVMQEPTLFNYSIKENIMYGTVSASNQAIKDAAQIANAIEFIETDELTEAFEDNPASLLKALKSEKYRTKVIEQVNQTEYDSMVRGMESLALTSGGVQDVEKISDLIDKRTKKE